MGEKSVTDLLAEAGAGWAAVGRSEVSVAVLLCLEAAPDFARAYQMLAAYLAIASARSNAARTAKITDEMVACMVPRVRGRGWLTAQGYRKTVKPALRSCGLVDYADGSRMGKAGKEPTEYSFPELERILEIEAANVAEGV